MFKMQTIVVTAIVLVLMLLNGQVFAELNWPEKPDNTVLTGVRYVRIYAVLESDADQGLCGTELLYEALMSNQLTQNSVKILADDDYQTGSVNLVFYLQAVEHTYASSGNKTGAISWTASLTVEDFNVPSRYDSLGTTLRVPGSLATIWRRGTLAFNPDGSDVKLRVREQLYDWVSEFVAELREANSQAKMKSLQEYWHAYDSVMAEYTKGLKK